MKLRLVPAPLLPPAEARPSVAVPPYDPRVEKERALASLVPLVRATVYRMLGPRVARDDVVQDALIEIARALERFEGRSSLETYARTITTRVAYRAMGRARSRECELDAEDHAGSGCSPERALASQQALERLHRCLARLPESRRTAFVLCGLEEMTPQDAAALVGTSPGAMRARFMHARRELARMLGPKTRDDFDGL